MGIPTPTAVAPAFAAHLGLRQAKYCRTYLHTYLLAPTLTGGRSEYDGRTERSVAGRGARLDFEVVGGVWTEVVHSGRRGVSHETFHNPLAIRLSSIHCVEQQVTCTTHPQHSC